MRILWFSNYRFSSEPIKATGTWLKVMGEELSKVESLELYNITIGNTKVVEKEVIGVINQYVLPSNNKYSNSIPNVRVLKKILSIIDDIKPDLIHVWGTEGFWGLVTMQITGKYKILLEIQGINLQIKQHYFGGMSPMEVIRSTGFKEFVRPKSHVFMQEYFYASIVENEKRIIANHKYISTQSLWSYNNVKMMNRDSIIFQSLRPLRDEFIQAKNTWSFKGNKSIFTSSSSLHPHKGLHIAIRALKVVVDSGINMTLNIAGHSTVGFRQSGYKRYLNSLIKSSGLSNNVNWLGPIASDQIVVEMIKSDMVIIPSYVESYCVSLHEAACVGVPIVCSYAGAMVEAENSNLNIAYFQPGDFMMAAHLMINMYEGQASFSEGTIDYVDSDIAVRRQLEIYSRVLKSST